MNFKRTALVVALSASEMFCCLFLALFIVPLFLFSETYGFQGPEASYHIAVAREFQFTFFDIGLFTLFICSALGFRIAALIKKGQLFSKSYQKTLRLLSILKVSSGILLFVSAIVFFSIWKGGLSLAFIGVGFVAVLHGFAFVLILSIHKDAMAIKEENDYTI